MCIRDSINAEYMGQGAVMASDAFFPFPDCVEIAHKEGITSVIQPGGSIKDQLSFDYCNENGVAMVTTGFRHFKHQQKMGLFSFTQEIAMDLGTANTIIITNGKIVVDEPSVVALDRRTDKMIAVGEKARQMHGKTHENIRTIRPLRDGVIADFYACEQMMRGMIKMMNTHNRFFSPSLRMVICVPSGSTEVELRAVRDSAEHAGGRDVYLIFEPMAAAIGIGIDVEAPEGNMIVDIGGGSTEIAVISLGGIVSNKSIRIAGDDLTSDIQEYMGRQHNLKVGERTAEQIKIHVGAALTELEDAPEDFIVHGPNRMTALPMEVPVCYQEIAHCLEKSIAEMETAILSALEQTPPELYADIVHNGIYLAGGGALLRGLDKRLTDKINIPFHIAEDPLHAVAKGTGVALKNVDRFSFLMRQTTQFMPVC
eukprot:TRINITY_DN5473_c0_g2_i1.p1 TRINITY_DN5473_c0_g2~~TRINITY_DN5473_c0_g2_i1.p1  ORF type:complete len:426 (-),score=41.26 TRINITY_DN5473_c0_g2_i1:440-1717(-)